jgi:hypothetical protein
MKYAPCGGSPKPSHGLAGLGANRLVSTTLENALVRAVSSRIEKPVITAAEVVDWMRAVIDYARSLPPTALTTISVAPAGQPLTAHFDDPELEAAYRVRLCDLPAEPRPVETIFVLSGKSPGLQMVPEWDGRGCPAPVFQEVMAGAGLRAAYPSRTGLWRFLDPRSGVGVQLSATRANLPKWDGSAPLRYHLHWLLEERGLRIAHAATLGQDGRGIVIFGRGGAGKSGTTLAGLEAGLTTVGDDLVCLGTTGQRFARALFKVFKQDRAGLTRSPSLSDRTSHLATNWHGKVEFDPDEYFPNSFVDELAIGAAVVPNIAHAEEPTVMPVTTAEIMRALISSNVRQYPGERETGMAFFAGFLRNLPCYRINLSKDAAKNGAALVRLIAQLPHELRSSAEDTRR